MLEEPINVAFAPLPALSEGERVAFEDVPPGDRSILPEMGTRAFLRALGRRPNHFQRSGEWIVVQPDRYRYAITETGGVLARMVLSEYLACEVSWEE